MKRRKFIKTAGLGAVGAVAATTIGAPTVKAQSTIKWRLQTYAGAALAEHVHGAAARSAAAHQAITVAVGACQCRCAAL